MNMLNIDNIIIMRALGVFFFGVILFLVAAVFDLDHDYHKQLISEKQHQRFAFLYIMLLWISTLSVGITGFLGCR